MSHDLTEQAIKGQLGAFGTETYELGVQDRNTGGMRLFELSAQEICERLRWLKAQNAHGHFIRIRPKWPHTFVFVDDLSADAISDMCQTGYRPCVIVESSPGNHQAWLNLGRQLEPDQVTAVAKRLAEQFGADPGGANWRQAGALAGFTNPKERHRRRDGLFPFVKLVEARSHVFKNTQTIVEYVLTQLKALKDERARWQKVCAKGDRARLKPVQSFHEDARYGGDLHRADYAWAIHALGCGLSAENAMQALLEARDLSHKGPKKRQEQYVERTVRSALRRGHGHGG